MIESYNGWWQTKVWSRFQHDNLAQLQGHSQRVRRRLAQAAGGADRGQPGPASNTGHRRAHLVQFVLCSEVVRPFMQATMMPHVLTAGAEAALKPGDVPRECPVEAGTDYCPQMVVVPAGSFMMGSTTPNQPNQSAALPQPPGLDRRAFCGGEIRADIRRMGHLR